MNDGLDSVEMAKRRYSSELAAYTLEQWNIARRAASSARAAAAASAGLAHVNEEEADGADGTVGVGSGNGGNGGKRKDHQRERSTENGDRLGDNSLGGVSTLT